MRKFSLLLGTLGGAMAGYILSNEKLRHELVKAKDPEAAAKALGTHLAKDGKKIAKEVKTFAESEDVQKNLRKAKTFAAGKFSEAKKNFDSLVKQSTKQAGKMMKDGMKSVRGAVKTAKGKAKKTAKGFAEKEV